MAIILYFISLACQDTEKLEFYAFFIRPFQFSMRLQYEPIVESLRHQPYSLALQNWKF